MQEPVWAIEFHTTDNGRCPVTDEFFPSLIPGDRVRVRKRLEMVRQHGPQYDEFSDKLTDDIFELRFAIQAGIVRLFFFYRPNRTIVITHGMCKKWQKTRRSDIELATQYRNEYLARGK